MAVKVLKYARWALFLALIILFPNLMAVISTTDVKQYPKAIYFKKDFYTDTMGAAMFSNIIIRFVFQELEEVIVRGLGFQSDDLKITAFDLKDALVGRSVAYEIDLEIDNQVLPLKLLDDVHKWQHVDLPILQVDDQARNVSDNGLVTKKKKKSSQRSSVLTPFKLAGPMELWIQDAKKTKLSLPANNIKHAVDDGNLRKVILADGAVVNVKGAKSVSLLRPIDLDLPMTKTKNKFASGFLTLSDRLKHASRTHSQLVSLSIKGPTSLTSPKPSVNKLKLNHVTSFWPIVSINGSNTNLISFETLLASILGPKASEEGSFRVLTAEISAQTFVKIGFTAEKLTGNGSEWEGYPEWRTKPEVVRLYFEVLARLNGDKIVPERVVQVDPVSVKDSMSPNFITGNISSSRAFTMRQPKLFTL
ncbi:hypothetical protein CTI12_AA296340 [Artemisia annua]|uniref:Uncharacterized protein n=1 Tax=Artemisia annua TaxID=35608 RepID=A0A2U1N731_ARTAN|nr:hypothetical protein CTI12_AA296340 [Artemisia annua]